jgi:undecaprenyl diphosphate synthase
MPWQWHGLQGRSVMGDAQNAIVTALPKLPDSEPPRHVAIIMDGNGRWASQRGLPRTRGHREGVEAARKTVRAAAEIGIGYLTLFGFSSENWSRPRAEVNDLFGLLRRFIRNDLAEIHENNIRLQVIGQREQLPRDIVSLIADAEKLTAANTGMTLVIAFNYGGRIEIVEAVRHLAEAVRDGHLDPAEINQDLFSASLQTNGIPDPDLIIRSSGENRISNFLLWQCAYSEFVFSPVLWPDFGREALLASLGEFSTRERRYGGIAVQV